MCIKNYLSAEKMQYIESLESLKRHRLKMLALSVNNYACKELLIHIDSVIKSESSKQETGKQIIEKIQNQTLKNILIYRYIRNYDWRKIVRIMRYSETQIYRLHNIALTEFDRIEDNLQLQKLSI